MSTKGNKPELVARLIEHYQKEAEEELGDELLDEEHLDESYEGDNKPAAGDVKKGTVTKVATKAPTADSNTAQDTPIKNDPSANKSDDTTGAVANKPVTQMTEKERAELRAKKFGVSEEEAKKIARRERFGPVDDGGLTKKVKLSDEDMEKFKARAKRFGSNVAPALTSIEDDAKKKQREKKFGTVPVTSMSMEVD